MLFKTFIVDDEPPICEEIAYMLAAYPDIAVTGTYYNGVDALTAIVRTPPDLLFLDVKMPGLSGIEVGRKLTRLPQPPLVVFVTAYDNFALDAFETFAVGYITKPIQVAALDEVIRKVRYLVHRFAAPVAATSGNAAATALPLNLICGRCDGRLLPINTAAITCIYAKDKNTYISTAQGDYHADQTLQELEQRLTARGFVRVHRNYLVNMRHVAEIIPWFHGTYLLRLDDGRHNQVPVGRSRVKMFRRLLQI